MTSSTQDLMLIPNELPPYSPIVYQPRVKHPYPFETNYSRESGRIRAVFNELVEKTKEMNLGKPETPTGKRRARNLGLKVDIDQAKGLHWRSIQARQPVVLTAGPRSPPRTPRRPATDYPTAEQLCLKNMAEAQKRQNYLEACRWSFFAEREHAISRWEAEQDAAYRARQAFSQDSTDYLSRLSPLDRLQTSNLANDEAEWKKSLSPAGSSTSNAGHLGRDSRPFTESSYPHSRASETQYQTVIEMPVPPMDRSQNLRPEAASSSYMLMGHDHLQSLNIPRGTDPSLWNARLSRSNSIQRHIPASSLRMAPTPLRPRIDHHSLNYPSPQASRISFIQPSETSSPAPGQNSSDMFGYPSVNSLNGLASSQTTTAVSSSEPVTPEQTFADDYILKKRRSEVEHYASSLKNEQRKLR